MTDYGIKLLKVPTSTGFAYQLYEAGGFGQSAGIRDITGNVQELINSGIPVMDLTNTSSSEYKKFSTGGLLPGQSRSKSNINASDFFKILEKYKQNDTLQQQQAMEQQRVNEYNANPVNTQSVQGPAMVIPRGSPAEANPTNMGEKNAPAATTGGVIPSWNPNNRLVWSVSGNQKEVPASEYQNYINSGWKASAPTPAPIPTPTPIIDTGDDALNKLLEQTQVYLDKLIQQGKAINPIVDITPEQAAKFLAQAQKEISPYYDTQMKLAREGLLRQAGYTSDEIMSQEAELERGYGRQLETMGETAAETGFALSGKRQLGEEELAQSTQRTLEQNRKLAEYNVGSAARQFAGEWGGQALPGYSYSATPNVQTGVKAFGRNLDTKPFYNISDSVYEGLKGSREYEQETSEKQRASELGGAWRTTEENRLRKLAL